MGHIPMVIQPDPEDPEGAAVLVDGTIAGRAYRFILDTGSTRTQVEADDYTSGLHPIAADISSGSFASETYSIVTISDLAVGPVAAASLDVTRAQPIPPHVLTLLEIDASGGTAATSSSATAFLK